MAFAVRVSFETAADIEAVAVTCRSHGFNKSGSYSLEELGTGCRDACETDEVCVLARIQPSGREPKRDWEGVPIPFAVMRSKEAGSSWSCLISCRRISRFGNRSASRNFVCKSVANRLPCGPTLPRSYSAVESPLAPTSKQRQPTLMPIRFEPVDGYGVEHSFNAGEPIPLFFPNVDEGVLSHGSSRGEVYHQLHHGAILSLSHAGEPGISPNAINQSR